MAKLLDAFGKPPTLYYRGQAKITTVPGCACTVTIFLILIIVLIHDLLAYPDMQVSQHASLNTESDYMFNPFLTENASEGLRLSFGIQKSAESLLEPFSTYKDIFQPVLYHVEFSGSFDDKVTDVPLVSCKASLENGYLDQKSGSLLCPVTGLGAKNSDPVEAVEEKEAESSSSNEGEKDEDNKANRILQSEPETETEKKDTISDVGLLRSLPGKANASYMVFAIRFVEGAIVD